MKSLPTYLFAGALAIVGSGAALAETAPSKVAGAPTSEIFFDFDSARLDETTADKLAPIVEFAKANPSA